jgi:predicted AAA+ superfamily ATPase
MTFSEFLVGLGEEQLYKYINGYTVESKPSDAAHDRLLMRLREYLLVGGMPEAVREFVATGSMNSVSPVHESIIETYRSDFSKYAALDDLVLLRRVFDFVPSAVGEKFKCVNVDPDSRAQKVKNAFTLLALAGLVAPIRHSSASGIPIAASADSNVFKPLFLDIGLMNSVSGIRALPLSIFQSSHFINEGKMAEQFVGQQLLYTNSTMRPELFYWLREGKKNNAEVDYLIQHDVHIIPVEVKSGKSGALKSLHRFMADKKGLLAVRFDLNQPLLHDVNIHVADTTGVKNITFKMLSLPLYFAEQCGKLIQEILP